MEEQLLSSCKHALTVSPTAETLASARSLITNPSTSASTISSLLETLARFLHLHLHTHSHPHLLHHVLNLLSDLAQRHPHLSPTVFNLLRQHSLLEASSTRIAAQSLALLAAFAASDQSFSPAMENIGEGMFLPLCFRPSVSVRPWLIMNAERFCVRPSVLLPVFLGFSKDPYPNVRRAALNGLVKLCKSVDFEDGELVRGCYCRAVELLNDMEDCVRAAAVRAVNEWGLKVASLHDQTSRREWSDKVFETLCCMIRDMSMEVRVDAFDALGRMSMVSEDLLWKTLSKKHSSNVSGAFMHGLEDEFYEVRSSACQSLRTLSILSSLFAEEALKLLMDVLNDYSVVVRLQALEAMNYMAKFDYMKLPETHMHMFLGTLLDTSALIRSEARKILQVVKLSNFEMLKSCVEGLLLNLDRYPQDEADIFSLLFKMGQSHGKFVFRILKDGFPEIESSFEGNVDFDNTRVAAFLVLVISLPLSHEKPVGSIPPKVFSYAAAFLGRFSRALSDIMSQNTLLAFLSRSTVLAEFESEVENPFPPMVESNIPNHASDHMGSQMLQSSLPIDEVADVCNIILARIKDLWPLVQSGRGTELLRILRSCKVELTTIATGSLDCTAPVAFTSEYLHLVELLVRFSGSCMPASKLSNHSLAERKLVLRKLNRCLKKMRYTFTGLRKEDELHILELILIIGMLELSKTETFGSSVMLKEMSNSINRANSLCKLESIDPSKFITELENYLNKLGTFADGDIYSPIILEELLNCFSLKEFLLDRSLKQVKADLDIPGYGSINPVPFISGLPVGVPFEIALYNIMNEDRLWLQMSVTETQFIFLDQHPYVDCDGVRKFTFTAPFYGTPKATSFKMLVVISKECNLERHFAKGCGGPKRELVHLCQEKEIYFSVIRK